MPADKNIILLSTAYSYIYEKKLLLVASSSFRYRSLRSISYPAEKLIEPAQLAATLQNTTAKKPAIFNVGPMAMIPDAVLIGETINPANQTKMRAACSEK